MLFCNWAFDLKFSGNLLLLIMKILNYQIGYIISKPLVMGGLRGALGLNFPKYSFARKFEVRIMQSWCWLCSLNHAYGHNNKILNPGSSTKIVIYCRVFNRFWSHKPIIIPKTHLVMFIYLVLFEIDACVFLSHLAACVFFLYFHLIELFCNGYLKHKSNGNRR